MLNVFEYELKEEQSKNNSKNKTTSSKTTSNKKDSSKETTSIQSTSKSKSNLPLISDNIPNINEREIRNAILSWHNEERKNV